LHLYSERVYFYVIKCTVVAYIYELAATNSLLMTKQRICNLLLLSILVSCSNKAGDNHFKRELGLIIQSASYSFQTIRDSVITLESGEKAFATSVPLDSTIFCWIGKMGNKPLYGAAILHDVNQQDAKEAVQQWDTKLQAALPSRFRRIPLKQKDSRGIIYDGVYFKDDELTMKVYAQTGFYNDKYSVLFVMNKD
jgi:hypothetical protein